MVLTRNLQDNVSFPTSSYRQHIQENIQDTEQVEDQDSHGTTSLLSNNDLNSIHQGTSREIELTHRNNIIHPIETEQCQDKKNNTSQTQDTKKESTKDNPNKQGSHWKAKLTEYFIRVTRLLQNTKLSMENYVEERGVLGIACNATCALASQFAFQRFGGKAGASVIYRVAAAVAGWMISDTVVEMVVDQSMPVQHVHAD